MTQETQAQRDARTAWTFAISCVVREGQVPRIGRGAAELADDYATDLCDQLGGDTARLFAAAREACIAAVAHVEYPGAWRSSLLAVELCQRAAQMAEPSASPASA